MTLAGFLKGVGCAPIAAFPRAARPSTPRPTALDALLLLHSQHFFIEIPGSNSLPASRQHLEAGEELFSVPAESTGLRDDVFVVLPSVGKIHHFAARSPQAKSGLLNER